VKRREGGLREVALDRGGGPLGFMNQDQADRGQAKGRGGKIEGPPLARDRTTTTQAEKGGGTETEGGGGLGDDRRDDLEAVEADFHAI
jgi:hypothetical protein